MYEGGESSRVYEGDWLVRSWFTWPDGQAGEHETEVGDYLSCQRWTLAAADCSPLVATDPDTGRTHLVRVERCIIERVD